MGKHVVVGLICFDHECQLSCTYNFRKLEKYINFSEDDSSKSRVHSLITFQSKKKDCFFFVSSQSPFPDQNKGNDKNCLDLQCKLEEHEGLGPARHY